MTNTTDITDLSNDELDALLGLAPEREDLWTERTRRIEARQVEIAEAEAAFEAEIDALVSDDNVRTLRGLSDTMVEYIVDQHGCLEGPEADDRFESGRTFVRTTARVWRAIAERFDATEYADAIVVAAYCGDAMHLVERNAERSAKAMGRKLAKVAR